MNIDIYINWFNANIILDINVVHSGGSTDYFTLVVTGIVTLVVTLIEMLVYNLL